MVLLRSGEEKTGSKFLLKGIVFCNGLGDGRFSRACKTIEPSYMMVIDTINPLKDLGHEFLASPMKTIRWWMALAGIKYNTHCACVVR